MQSKAIIAIHGIRVEDPDFYRPMQKNLIRAGRTLPFFGAFWTPAMDETIALHNLCYRPVEVPWWKVASRARRAISVEAQRASVWVMAYLVRPEVKAAVRAAVAERIESAVAHGHAPFTLIAHSLGTLAAVDVLADMDTTPVWSIVTMGSPLGYMAPVNRAIDKIRAITYGGSWINLYDPTPSDWVASRLSGLSANIIDIPVETGGLLTAHTSMWQSERVAKLISSVL